MFFPVQQEKKLTALACFRPAFRAEFCAGGQQGAALGAVQCFLDLGPALRAEFGVGGQGCPAGRAAGCHRFLISVWGDHFGVLTGSGGVVPDVRNGFIGLGSSHFHPDIRRTRFAQAPFLVPALPVPVWLVPPPAGGVLRAFWSWGLMAIAVAAILPLASAVPVTVID